MAAVVSSSSSSSRNTSLGLAAGAVGAAALIGAAALFARHRRQVREHDKKVGEQKAAEEKKVALAAVPMSLEAAQPGATARIAALASAFPPNSYPQRVFHEQFKKAIPTLTAEDESFVDRVFAGTGFDSCSSYLEPEQLFRKMTRTQYTVYIKKSLRDLALRSSKEAIAQWGGDKSTITHIVFGTMTGSIHAPTMDVELARGDDAEALGLQVGIKRLNVEGMGCMTGYRCLGLANDIARADPRNVVLLIVCDIRSALGNQLSEYNGAKDRSKTDAREFKANVIASALFRDSGAAAIIQHEATAKRAATEASKQSTAPLYEILDHRSTLVPNSFDLVEYKEKDNAVIYLYISPDLPKKIKEVLRPRVELLLKPYGIRMDDCTFSVHTGGPKVLHYVAESLGVPKSRMASSWYCMKKWGNLSGSSNLVVLDQWRKLPSTMTIDGETVVPESKKYVVCMSFGPGVGMELLLLRATSPEVGAEGV